MSDDNWFACCEHCGCETAAERALGHDDTCALDCNDDEMELGR